MKSIMDLMFLKAASGGGVLVEQTAAGNPATFTTNVRKEIVSMTIPIFATQEGSGTPSQDNVRPIVGQNGLIVYHSGTDTSNPEVITAIEGATIYGGTFDLTTGEISVTHFYASLYPAGAASGFFYTTTGEAKIPMIESLNAELMADRFKIIPNTSGYETESAVTFYANGIIRWVEYDCKSMTLQEYRTYLAQHPEKIGHVCYKLQTPITGTFDPKSITTLKGVNNIWSNSSGTNTVVYLEKE